MYQVNAIIRTLNGFVFCELKETDVRRAWGLYRAHEGNQIAIEFNFEGKKYWALDVLVAYGIGGGDN